MSDRDVKGLVYVGIKGGVAAIDRRTGDTVWMTPLPGTALGGTFVNILFDGGQLFAHGCGSVFCLDPETGNVIWRNKLEGCGYGIATLSTANSTDANLPAIVETIANTRRSSNNS